VIYFTSANTFFIAEYPNDFNLTRDPDGTITGFTLFGMKAQKVK